MFPVGPGPDAPLVGRGPEMATLRTAWELAFQGAGGVVLVVGLAGIGKTRLAQALAVQASADGDVVWARCHEEAADHPFWPWGQAFASLLRIRGRDRGIPLLGLHASDLAQMLPQLRDVIADLPATPAANLVDRVSLFDAVTSLLHAASHERPFALILEDLHAADESSLLLLGHLAAEVQDSRALIVGTLRDPPWPRPGAVRRALAEVARHPNNRAIAVGGLQEAEVAAFLRVSGLRPGPGLVARLHELTEGNPFYLGEVVRVLADAGHDPAGPDLDALALPPGIAAVLTERLARLTPRATTLVEIASTIGHEFTLELLQRVSDQAAEELLTVLDEAELAGIVLPVPHAPTRYAFSDALTRRAVYDGMTSVRRARLHAAVAAAIEASFGPRLHGVLPQLARHFFLAGLAAPLEKTIAYCSLAGDRAMEQFAYVEAVEHYRRALDVADLAGGGPQAPHDILLALGEAYRRSGDDERRRKAYREAAAAAQEVGASDALAHAALGYADPISPIDDVDPVAVDLLERALAAVGPEDGTLRVRILARRSLALRRRPAEQLESSAEAVHMARRLSDPRALAVALDARLLVTAGTSPAEDRLAVADELLRAGEQTGDPELLLRGRHWRGWELLERGEADAADSEVAAYARIAERLHEPSHRWYVAYRRAARDLVRGEFAAAERGIAETLALGRPAVGTTAAHVHAFQLFQLRRLQGRLDETRELLRSLREESVATPVWRCMTALVDATARRLGPATRALRTLAAGRFEAVLVDLTRLPSLALLAETAARVCDERGAVELYELLAPHSERVVVAPFASAVLGAAAHYLGLLAATLGRHQVAGRHFEQALELHERLESPPLLAQAGLAYGEVLLARGRSSDRALAERLLAEATEKAETLGMKVLLGEAERLSAAAYRDAGGVRTVRCELSPREMDVARLVHEGLTNREIAQRLVLSRRTVDRHVENIRAKLGVHSRAQIAAWVAQQE